MSLPHRLLAIETAIAFEDVHDSWRFAREAWLCEVVAAAREPQTLAALTLQLLGALTAGCIAHYWKQPARFKKLTETAAQLARSTRDSTGAAVKAVIAELEAAITPPDDADGDVSLRKAAASGVVGLGPDPLDVDVDLVAELEGREVDRFGQRGRGVRRDP